MMRIIISVFVMILIFINCTDKGSKKIKQIELKDEQKAEIINDYLTVIMKVRVFEEDVFEIYYAEDLEKTYAPQEKVRSSINGSNELQEITFKFPKRVYPLKLRIDLGLNKNETDIEIVEIKLTTGAKSITLSTTEIVQRFRFNKYIFHNPEMNSFSRKTIDDLYDPLMLSGDLSHEIIDIFSE